MAFIKILPDNLINKIAAGEVVERPASVVKELIENSLDAGATEIVVEIEQSGKRLIRITDDGMGMPREDAELAFHRHATSKISSEADLEAIRTMGFRGEALASIAAVAQVRMRTAQRGAQTGVLIEIDGGTMRPAAVAAPQPGTSIAVHHLFFNTPARLKFLKSPATETSHIIAAVSRQALAHPSVRFRLTIDEKTVLDLPASSDTRERLFQIHGSEISENVIEIADGRDGIRIAGLAGKPNYSRADKTYQEFYVNGRFVRNNSLSHALYAAYDELLMRGRHPVAFLFLEIDPALVDVNVHPAKAEVRFRNQAQVHDFVRNAVRQALRATSVGVPAAGADDRVREAVADYLSVQEQAAAQPVEHNPHLFGRRKSDGGTTRHPEHVATVAVSQPALPSLGIPHLIPIGQVHDSFIVAQSPDGMALVDQHAAHERVLFEKLQDQHTAGNMPLQSLLMPVTVEPGPADAVLLSEYLPELGRLGLVVEDFGGGAFVIKAVPALLTGGDYKKLLLDLLDEVKVHGQGRNVEVLRDEFLAVMACHPAIKVHRKLSIIEMERLLRDLFSCRMPHSCPHGRPTVVSFSMDEIRKMFKRI